MLPKVQRTIDAMRNSCTMDSPTISGCSLRIAAPYGGHGGIVERLLESLNIGWSRFASISPGSQDAQSCFDQFLGTHRASPGLFNILDLNVCFCTWATSFGLPIHLVRSSILGTGEAPIRAQASRCSATRR